ncbi:MAG: radical SAM protein, partial [Candidatus Eremiobacteraeota bacterium]|nr:radical SAM protein [Candidatus Eremiobacteraeota bacterium]
NELKIIQENLGEKAKEVRINLWDDNFCLNRKRTNRLCEAIIKSGIDLLLHAELRAELVDRELLELLYAAGIRMVNFGLESAVPRILRNIKKVNGKSPDLEEEKEFIEAVRRAVKWSKEIGFHTTVSVIYGLPGETLEDGIKTHKFVNELEVDMYSHNQLFVYSGSKIFKDHKRFGLKVKPGKDIFPLEVEYLYNLDEIPFSPKTYIYRMAYRNQRYLRDILFGWWGVPRHMIETIFPAIILGEHKILSYKEIEWLQRVVKTNAPVILFYDHPEGYRDFLPGLIENLLEHLPTKFFFILVRSGRKTAPGHFLYRLLTEKKERRKSPFSPYHLLAPLSHAKKIKKNRTGGQSRLTELYYTVETGEDLALLKKELSDYDPDHSIFNRIIQQSALITSACRFSHLPCPGISLAKLHVDEDMNIKICPFSGPIGTVGESLETLKARVGEIFSKKMKDRGCASCPVKDTCSKCIFPYPMSDKEYCEFRRKYRELPYVLARVEMLKDFAQKRLMGYEDEAGMLARLKSGAKKLV